MTYFFTESTNIRYIQNERYHYRIGINIALQDVKKIKIKNKTLTRKMIKRLT